MKIEERKPTVEGTMRKILNYLNSPQEQKSLAGDLAAIRNTTGKQLEEAEAVWPIMFPLLPPEFLGNGPLTREERSLLLTLQLYAIGQQGTDKMLNDDESSSVGSSLRRIRNGNPEALDRRFNAMLTATTFEEFAYHLRQLFKQGKSKSAFSVNFPRLAGDLFWYQNGNSKQVCLKWARDYYKTEPKTDQTATETINQTVNPAQ